MLKVSVVNITDTLRYKLVSIDNQEFYLVDIQPSFLLIVCPILHLLIKKKYYNIDKSSYMSLKSDRAPKASLKISYFIWIGLFVSSLFRVVPISFFEIHSVVINYLLIFFIIVLVSYFRWKYSRTPESVKVILSKESEQYLKLRYLDLKLIILCVVTLFIGLLLYLITKEILFKTSTNIILHLIFMYIYMAYLFVSLMFYSVGEYKLIK